MIKLFLTVVLFVLNANIVFAQEQNPAQSLASKQAKKMQDSLNLTNAERQQIFQINMDLHKSKTEVRQNNTNNRAETGRQLQRIENTRDSLYRTVLAEQKYQLYRQKKRNLINNN
jgi:hypothetical protein